MNYENFHHYVITPESPLAGKFDQFEKDFIAGRKATQAYAKEIGADGWYSAGGKVTAFQFHNSPGGAWRDAKIRGNRGFYAPRSKGDESLAIKKRMDALMDLGGWELQKALTDRDNVFMYMNGLSMRALTAERFVNGNIHLMIPKSESKEAWYPKNDEAQKLTLAEAYKLIGENVEAKAASQEAASE